MADLEEDFYQVLDLSRDATREDIKSHYQKLVKKYHPDKLPPNTIQSEKNSATEQFQRISRAYDTLSDSKKKLEYDKALNADLVTQECPVSDTVDLDDMIFEPSTGSYVSPCRCGGEYAVGEEELGEGVGLVCCTTCSLSIRITYQEQVEKEEK